MRKWAALLSTAAIALSLAACGDKETKDQATDAASGEKYALKYNGEAGLVMPAELAEDLGYFKKVKLDYQGASKGGPESIQYVATKQIDFGNSFNGAIIKSIEKGVKIKGVITAYGSTSENFMGLFAKKGTDIQEAKDLIGKKVAINIRGAHLEMMVSDYLYKQGLTKEEVDKVQFVTLPTINTEQAIVTGQVDAGIIAYIFRDKALENGDTEVVFKDTDTYDGDYNAGSYFFHDDFIQEHEAEVADFTQGVAKAYEWLEKTDRDEVVERFEKILEKRDRGESTEPLKYWKSSNVSSTGGKIEEKDYERWLEGLQRSGDVSSTDIDVTKMYTNEFNPY